MTQPKVKEGQIWREVSSNRHLLVELLVDGVATCFPMALNEEGIWLAVGGKTLISVELLGSDLFTMETTI